MKGPVKNFMDTYLEITNFSVFLFLNDWGWPFSIIIIISTK